MDARLSRNGTMSCAMCHIPEQGFAAVELSTPVGIEGRSLSRNAPSLLNVAWVGQLFHDGRAASLESQAWDPMLNPIEMGNADVREVLERIRSLPDYAGQFEAAFDGKRAERDNVAAALSAYQRTLVAGNSRFDRWRYGEDKAALTQSEQAGFAVFAGKGKCISCHTVGQRDALFTDGRFHDTGIGRLRQATQADPARAYAVQLAPGVTVQVPARDLANVSEAVQDDQGRFDITGKEADRYAYRTPSLRNLALTPPYMHDGSLPSIEAVIAFYQAGGGQGSALLVPLALSEEETKDLAAFLRALNGDQVTALARDAREPVAR
jgi:cytochrome c peroxidase